MYSFSLHKTIDFKALWKSKIRFYFVFSSQLFICRPLIIVFFSFTFGVRWDDWISMRRVFRTHTLYAENWSQKFFYEAILCQFLWFFCWLTKDRPHIQLMLCTCLDVCVAWWLYTSDCEWKHFECAKKKQIHLTVTKKCWPMQCAGTIFEWNLYRKVISLNSCNDSDWSWCKV